MEKMGAKRDRKVKGGRAAAEAAAAASEGGRKLSTRYKGAAEANPSNYVLLYVRGKVGADREVHDAREADGERGGAGVREGDEQQGERKGERPWPPPKKVGLAKLRLMRSMAGREAV